MLHDQTIIDFARPRLNTNFSCDFALHIANGEMPHGVAVVSDEIGGHLAIDVVCGDPYPKAVEHEDGRMTYDVNWSKVEWTVEEEAVLQKLPVKIPKKKYFGAKNNRPHKTGIRNVADWMDEAKGARAHRSKLIPLRTSARQSLLNRTWRRPVGAVIMDVRPSRVIAPMDIRKYDTVRIIEIYEFFREIAAVGLLTLALIGIRLLAG